MFCLQEIEYHPVFLKQDINNYPWTSYLYVLFFSYSLRIMGQTIHKP